MEFKPSSELFSFLPSPELAANLDRRRLAIFTIDTCLRSIVNEVNRQVVKADSCQLEFRNPEHLVGGCQERHVRHELAPG